MTDPGPSDEYPDELDRLAGMIARMGRAGDLALAATIRDAAAEIRRLRARMAELEGGSVIVPPIRPDVWEHFEEGS